MPTVRCPSCIVSNADRAELAAAVENSEINVVAVVTSEDAQAYKPDPRIFEYALERTGWQRERVLHVGDSLHADVGGAIAAGVRNGWVNREPTAFTTSATTSLSSNSPIYWRVATLVRRADCESRVRYPTSAARDSGPSLSGVARPGPLFPVWGEHGPGGRIDGSGNGIGGVSSDHRAGMEFEDGYGKRYSGHCSSRGSLFSQLTAQAGQNSDVYTAARLGDFTRVTELLQADPGLAQAQTVAGETALHAAAAAGHADIVELLLAYGADVNAADNHGETAPALGRDTQGPQVS